MKGFEQVTIQDARPLPVIILADTSGSMQENGKIEALNVALKDMLLSFGQQSSLGAEIYVGVITFGGEVKCLYSPKPACQFEPQTMGELTADGGTPFGKAIQLVKELLEDKNTIPSRSYRPMIVAISDGYPTDAWEIALEEFFKSERASKTIRVAMAIGPDADEAMLKKFVNKRSMGLLRMGQR